MLANAKFGESNITFPIRIIFIWLSNLGITLEKAYGGRLTQQAIKTKIGK